MTSYNSKSIANQDSYNPDPYDLSRFLDAQEASYPRALSEIRQGYKTSHWIWYIFPQLRDLGYSDYATYYGIADLNEAKAYLENSTLRNHLLEISEALCNLTNSDIEYIMGSPIDAKKLQSSMTLFYTADPSIEIFSVVLDKFYGGKPDQDTLKLLGIRD